MTRKLGWFLLATALAVPSAASAQPPGPGAGGPSASPTVSAEDQARAQQHFQRAKDLYQAGSYREAITELEQARALDPKAKELVFNLGIVHEKLARFDEAIGYFQKYLEMEGVTPVERSKAESIIKRIEGAKREVQTPSGSEAQRPTGPSEGIAAGDTGGTGPAAEPARGRVDAATIAAASVAVVGLGVGTVFGIRALALNPSSSFTTGKDGSYADLTRAADDAHGSAQIADVGLAVGVVGLVATAVLYFGRTRDAAPAPPKEPVKEPAKEARTFLPSLAPLPGGAALSAVGTF